MDWLHGLLQTTWAKGAISGFVSAFAVDVQVFLKMAGWSDLKAFNWSVATWRWCIGAVTGALTGAGFGALVG